LTETPGETVALFEAFLKPARPVASEQLTKLIADLKSDEFQVRDHAQQELSRLGELAESRLRKTLAGESSLEFSRRVQRLLDDLQPKSPRRPRLIRTVEVLEFHRTRQAHDLLAKLAGGVPEAWLTQEARRALERVERRGTDIIDSD
jgi:hypothetical protein